MNNKIRDALLERVEMQIEEAADAKNALHRHNKLVRELSGKLKTSEITELENSMWGMVHVYSLAMFEWGVRIGHNPTLLIDFQDRDAAS